MKRLHVVGRKNHGKTTLVVDLIQTLTAQGLRIGTIKHTHHRHELDTPGKDSHRHRCAGAVSVGILSPEMSAVYWPNNGDESSDDAYQVFAGLQSACDLILVEGDTRTTADKIEVWREAAGGDPIAAADPTIQVVVTNDDVDVKCAVLQRDPMDDLVRWIACRHSAAP